MKVWSNRTQDQRLLFIISIYLIFVASIAIIGILTLEPVLDELLSVFALSELRLLERTYNEKVHLMEKDFTNLATDPDIKSYVSDPSVGEDAVSDKLSGMMKAHQIEYTSLVKLHDPSDGHLGGEIILSANGARDDGDILTPGDLFTEYTCCIAEPIQSEGESIVTYDELTKENPLVWRERISEFDPIVPDHMEDLQVSGIFRWVLTPVVTDTSDCTGGIAAVLVGGDVVNGKVPIVATPTSLFGNGYTSVWYMDSAEDELHQATSYVAFDRGERTVLAGHKLKNPSRLRSIYDRDDGEVSVFVDDVLGHDYTIAARRLPGSPVILARGPSRQQRDRDMESSRDEILWLMAIPLAVDIVGFYFAYTLVVEPLKRIARRIARRRANEIITAEDFPTKRGYTWVVLGQNAVLIVVAILIIELNKSTISSMQASTSTSELNVMSHMYQAKNTDMKWMLKWEAEKPLVKSAVEDYLTTLDANDGECVNSEVRNLTSVQQLGASLKARTEEMKVELALLLDRDGLIIVNPKNGHNSDMCEFFDQSGIVSSIAAATKTIIMTSVLPNGDFLDMFFEDNDVLDSVYTERYTTQEGIALESDLNPLITGDDAWIRWVAEPVYSPSNTAQAEANCEEESHVDAVLLLGDVINGKLGNVGSTMDIFKGDGYTAIYGYDYALDEFVLVSSLFSNGGQMEVDTKLPDNEILMDVFLSGKMQTRDRVDINGIRVGTSTFSVSAAPIDPAMWVTLTGGVTEVPGEIVGILVRGTPLVRSADVQAAEDDMVNAVTAALVVALLVRLALSYELFRPSTVLLRQMVARDIVAKTTTTTNSGGTTSNSSNTSSSGGGGKKKKGTAWYIHLSIMKGVQMGLGVGMFACLLAAAVVKEKTLEGLSHDDMEAMIDVAGATGEYLFATMQERDVTMNMIYYGKDEDGSYPADRLEAVEATRLEVDAASSRFLGAASRLNVALLSEEFIANLKSSRKDVYGLRRERVEIDNDVYEGDYTAAALYINDMQTHMVEMLGEITHLSKDFYVSELAFGLWNILEYADAFSKNAVNLEYHIRGDASERQFTDVFEFRQYHQLAQRASVALENYVLSGTEHMNELFEDLVPSKEFHTVEDWEFLAVKYPESFVPPEFPTNYKHISGNATIALEGFRELSDELHHELVVANDAASERTKSNDAKDLFRDIWTTGNAVVMIAAILFLDRSKRHKAKKFARARKMNSWKFSWWLFQRTAPFLLVAFGVALMIFVIAYMADIDNDHTVIIEKLDVMDHAVHLAELDAEIVEVLDHERLVVSTVFAGGWDNETNTWFLAHEMDEVIVDTDHHTDAYQLDLGDTISPVIVHELEELDHHRELFLAGNLSSLPEALKLYEDIAHHMVNEILAAASHAPDGNLFQHIIVENKFIMHIDALELERALMRHVFDPNEDGVGVWSDTNPREMYVTFLDTVVRRDSYIDIFTYMNPELGEAYAHADDIPAQKLLDEWEDHLSTFPDTLDHPTSDQFYGNITAVLEAVAPLGVEEKEYLAKLATDARKNADDLYHGRFTPLMVSLFLIPPMLSLVMLVYAGKAIVLSPKGFPIIVNENLKNRGKSKKAKKTGKVGVDPGGGDEEENMDTSSSKGKTQNHHKNV